MTVLTVLLSVTAYSAAIYAAILLFRIVFRKHVSAIMLYVAWFLLIARLLIPITVDSGFSLITLPAQDIAEAQDAPDIAGSGNQAAYAEGEGLSAAAADNGLHEQPAASQGAAASGFTPDVPAVLISVWVLGMLVMLLHTMAALIKLKKRLLKDPAPVPDEWLHIAEKIKAQLNIRGSVRVMMIKDLASPALIASVYPSILMPAQQTKDIEKIEFALRHEMMHLKRKDNIVCLLLIILRVIYWFNPVIWLASRQMKIDMETACDSAAVSPLSREETKRYAGTVLDMYAKENVRFALGMSLGSTRKTAERRIRGIFMRRHSSLKAKAAAAVLAAIMLFACFTTACQPVQEEPPLISNTPAETAVTPTPEPSETASGPIESEEPAASPTASPTPALMPIETLSPDVIASMPWNNIEEAEFSADLDGDGTQEIIVLSSGDNRIRLYVMLSDRFGITDVEEGTFKSAYLTRTGNGDICLLVSIDEASEDYVTFTFSFSGTKPVLRGEAGGYASKVSGTQATLCGHGDAIGTWDYTCKYKLNNDFTLKKTSDYTIVPNFMEPLHTIRELPVEMLTGGEYIAGILPADTILTPVMTDWNSYMTFRLQDGSEGRIRFTRGEHVEVYLGGIIESEYFDNIQYSD